VAFARYTGDWQATMWVAAADGTGARQLSTASAGWIDLKWSVDDRLATGTVERWAGADRFASSAAFSARSYAAGVGVAYVASGLNFPDALSGAPIAGKTGGPVLLTGTSSLPAPIVTELKRLKPKKIVILGGTGAVSGAVAAELAKYLG
jgi:putative cell wall-binding protein